MLDGVDPTLLGDRVALRPILPPDVMVFHSAEHTASPLGLSRLAGRTLSIESYAESLSTSVLVAMSVVESETLDLIGYGLCYEADFVSDRAKFAVMTLPRFRGSVLSMNGVELFLRYLFAHFPFRSLYADVFEPNLGQFASAEAAGLLERQGTFPDYQFWQGRYVSMNCFRVSREGLERYLLERPSAQGTARHIPETFSDFAQLVAAEFGCDAPAEATLVINAGFDSLAVTELALWCEELAQRPLDVADQVSFGELFAAMDPGRS